MKINNYYANSVGGNQKDFIDFVKQNSTSLTQEDVKDVDFLIQRIAQNLFYYEDNLATAKCDYIALVALLIKKGVIFENI